MTDLLQSISIIALAVAVVMNAKELGRQARRPGNVFYVKPPPAPNPAAPTKTLTPSAPPRPIEDPEDLIRRATCVHDDVLDVSTWGDPLRAGVCSWCRAGFVADRNGSDWIRSDVREDRP